MDRVNYLKVKVGNPENNNDIETGNGKVNYEYFIGKYTVTLGQYTNFLNSIAYLDDPNSVYNISMFLSKLSYGITKNITNSRYIYITVGPSGTIIPDGADSVKDRPIGNVPWGSIARFANWMSNGQPVGEQNETTTENGAYNLLNYDSIYSVKKNDINPNTNKPPTYYIPTENEWFKAAYYNQSLNDGLGGYYKYATQSNESPQNLLTDRVKNSANYITQDNGLICVTQGDALSITQNFITNVGAFYNSESYYGTYDQSGNVWEILDPNENGSLYSVCRGGAFTSFIGYIDSKFSVIPVLNEYSSNFGFRLASPIEPKKKVIIQLNNIDNINNINDSLTGLGSVSYKYSISKFLITIENYVNFLNSTASKSDPNNLYIEYLNTDRRISGITRSGSENNYYYSVNQNYGDSSNRPITYVNWFCAARFANWMSNGQPEGVQDSTTTENGAYDLSQSNGFNTVYRNSINPNTGEIPVFFIPSVNEWYKAAYYSPTLNSNSGGYYKFGTQSNDVPGNDLADTDNRYNNANYVLSSNLYYSVNQSASLDVNKNYLTNVGLFVDSKSYYGLYDMSGNACEWNDMNSNTSFKSNIRGGPWTGADKSINSTAYYNAGNNLRINDLGFRLSSYTQV